MGSRRAWRASTHPLPAWWYRLHLHRYMSGPQTVAHPLPRGGTDFMPLQRFIASHWRLSRCGPVASVNRNSVAAVSREQCAGSAAVKENLHGCVRPLRGHRLLLVPTYRLNEAVKRNRRRFPADFMFQLNKKEAESLTSQSAISKKGRGGRRTLPYAFTEQGVAMLSSVLNSEWAIEVNIAIMRAFVKLRQMLAPHAGCPRWDPGWNRTKNSNGSSRLLFESWRRTINTSRSFLRS